MDITPILEAVLALVSAIITCLLVPWIKRKNLEHWVDIAVAAAQQLYYSETGQKRKAYVIDFLQTKGYKVDNLTIDALIEASVLKLHQSLEYTDSSKKSVIH